MKWTVEYRCCKDDIVGEVTEWVQLTLAFENVDVANFEDRRTAEWLCALLNRLGSQPPKEAV